MNYVNGSGPDTSVIIGGILEIIVGLACIGSAVVRYPVLKKQNHAAALGLVVQSYLQGYLDCLAT